MNTNTGKSLIFSVRGDPGLSAGLRKVEVEGEAIDDALKTHRSFLEKRGWTSKGEAHPEIARVWVKRVRDPKNDALLKRYGVNRPAYRYETAMNREEELSAVIHDYAEKATLAAGAGKMQLALHHAYLCGHFSGIAHTAWRFRMSKRTTVKGLTTSQRIEKAHTIWSSLKQRSRRFGPQDLVEIDPSFYSYAAESLRVLIARSGCNKH